MSRNQQKQDEISRNQPKRHQKNVKRPIATQNFKIWEIQNFLIALVFQTSSPNAHIWVFWAMKHQLSNLSTKYCLHFIWKVLISNLTLVFDNVSPNPQIFAFCIKKYQFSNLNKILPVPYFERADFKSDICFQKSLA